MKRMITLIVSCMMIVISTVYAYPVISANELQDFVIPVVSDIADIMHLHGKSNETMLKEGILMIPIEEACKIVDASIMTDDAESIIISRNTVSWCCEYNDEDNQYLIIDMHTGDGDYYQSINQQLKDKPLFWKISKHESREFKFNQYDDDCFSFIRAVDLYVKTDIDFQMINNELYVSLCPFLEMMGVKIQIINEESIQQQLELLNTIADIINYEKRFTLNELKEKYRDLIGCETYLSCTLGLPIDKLYQEYYNGDYMFKLEDYYTGFETAVSNIINSVANFDGFSKTIMSAEDLDYKYQESLINVIAQKGISDGKDVSNDLQDSANYYSIFNSTLDFFLDKNSDLFELKSITSSPSKSKLIDTITTAHAFNDAVPITDLFDVLLSGYIGYYKSCLTLNQLETLFDDDRKILKESILSSEVIKDRSDEDKRNRWLANVVKNMFGISGNISYTLYNTSKINNSYYNLYSSTEKVQLYFDDPEKAKAFDTAYESFCSILDNLFLGIFDEAVCKGIPVSQVACSMLQIGGSKFQNTVYYKNAHSIANLDDYVFIQSIAKACFYDNYLKCEGEREYYSFVLGVKSTLTAHIENKRQKKTQHELERILSDATNANRDYYRTNLKYSFDLSDMIQEINENNNTNVKGITTTTQATTDTDTNLNEEDLFYDYIKNELVPNYGLADVETEISISKSNGIVSAYIYDLGGEAIKYMLVCRLEYNNNDVFPVLMLYTIVSDGKITLIDEEKCSYSWTNISIRFDNNKIYISGQTIPKTVGAMGWNIYELMYSIDGMDIVLTENVYGRGSDEPKGKYNENAKLLMELKTSQMTQFIETDTYKIIDYTDLRSHIENNIASNISGRYTSDNIYIDVDGELDHEGTIRVEYIVNNYFRSVVKYNGIITKNLSFSADDWYCTNSFNLVFDNKTVHITIPGNPDWGDAISGTTLPQLDTIAYYEKSDIPDYNITTWTNEMFATAINNYLMQSENLHNFKCFPNEIKNEDNSVMLHYISGENFENGVKPIVLWNKFGDDYAVIGQSNSDIFGDVFHLTEYLTTEISSINKPTASFDITKYCGRYECSDMNLWVDITEAHNGEIEIKVEFLNESGTKQSESHYKGLISTNPFTYEADDGWGINSYTLEFLDDKIKVNAYCVECTSGYWGIPNISAVLFGQRAVQSSDVVTRNESDTINMEIEPEIHYYGTETVNGILLKYDLYLSANKNNIFVSAPTEIGGSIGYTLNNITYSDGIYYYSDSEQSEFVPGAIRSLVEVSNLTGYVKVIDSNTIEWNNQANGNIGRSFTLTLTK